MGNWIMNRKIGAFEVLVTGIPLSILFGTRFETLIIVAACIGFWYAKNRFGGEFSLADVLGNSDAHQPVNKEESNNK